MSPLRRRMIEDMTVRNLSPYIQRNYLFAVSRLARHIRMSPADVGPEQLRDYLKYLVERKVSLSYFYVNVAALRFLYTVVCKPSIAPMPTADMGLHDVALDIGLSVSHSTYDTLYVAFALAVGATNVVVADGPFAKAMARHPDPAVAGMLMTLDDWTRVHGV